MILIWVLFTLIQFIIQQTYLFVIFFNLKITKNCIYQFGFINFTFFVHLIISGLFAQLHHMFQQVIQKIYVRPIRQKYFHYDLGPKCSSFNPTIYKQKRKNLHKLSGKTIKIQEQPQILKLKREDHKIQSLNTQQLHVSYFQTQNINSDLNNTENQFINKEPSQITLIYLHTHNGSKLQGIHMVQQVLSMAINFCIFDFTGYGNSKGDYVTLGIKQIHDLERVLQFLEEEYDQVGFVLWGRSMGAVTALKYLSSSHYKQSEYNILGAIYDSPFASLQQLTYQMSSKNLNIPQTILTPLIYLIKSSLKEKVPFEELQLVNEMRKINVPCVFMASKKDSFIDYSHTQRLYREYNSRYKQIVYIQKNHNESRGLQDLWRVYEFVEELVERRGTKEKIVMRNWLVKEEQEGRQLKVSKKMSKEWVLDL